jgi:hypothetical protein
MWTYEVDENLIKVLKKLSKRVKLFMIDFKKR